MRLVPPLVARARTHARRFPRTFWLLVVVGAIRELGSGVFIPYWALYLTGTLGASGAQAGALIALAGGMGALIGFVLVWRRFPETRPALQAGERPRFGTALRDRRLLALAAGAGISVAVYAVFDAALGPFLHRDRSLAIATWGLLFTIN